MMNMLSPCLQSMLLFFCLVDVHDLKTFMLCFAPQNYSYHIFIAKSFWAYNLPLQHSSATREFYQFVSWWLQEQELMGQQQRQCQRLVRERKGVSQQQEHVNGVNANQRSDEVKYGRYGASLGGPLCDTSKNVGRPCLIDESRVKQHKKSTNHLPNTITMVVKSPTPPAAWIWQTHAAWGVGGLAHVRSNAAIEAIQ
jgi:hypothetical protein